MTGNHLPPLKVDLRQFTTREGLPGGDNDRGTRGQRILWPFVKALVFLNPVLPLYGFKARLLRMFGARVGEGVVIKPGVNITRPWNVTIGDYTWLGERAWIDSGASLDIGSHVVLSQGVYLVSGTHDWQDPAFGSVQAPIVVQDGAWIAAFAQIAGNVTVGQEALVTMGSVVISDCEPRGAYRGNPAKKVGQRRIRDVPGPPRAMPAPTSATRESG